jgi:hypothetical protein
MERGQGDIEVEDGVSDDGVEAVEAVDVGGDGDGEKPRFEVNGVQVCASTLASVSGAVVASVFGVTGTVVGAAVGSVIATTGSAIYSHGIRRGTEKLQQTQAAQLAQLMRRRPRATGLAAGAPADAGANAAAQDGSDQDGTRDGEGLRERLARHRLGVIAGVVLVFVASLAAITLVEVASRRSIADIAGHHSSGDTSIGSILGGGKDDDTDEPDSSTTTVPAGSDEAPDSSSTTVSDGGDGDGGGDTPTTESTPSSTPDSTPDPTTAAPESG